MDVRSDPEAVFVLAAPERAKLVSQHSLEIIELGLERSADLRVADGRACGFLATQFGGLFE
jgi:hypothetical protein